MAREMKDSGIEWIGEIPREWSVYPAKFAFSEIRNKNTDGEITKALKFYNGTIIPKSNFDANSDDYVAETITTYTVVKTDMIMINGLNLNYDLKSLRVGLVKEEGVITSAYLALMPDVNRILPLYATYLFKGYETRMAFHNMGAGIRKTLGFKEFKNQPVLIPSLSEQQAIADFLDTQCVHIDSVIEKTRAAIEEYKRLKQSVITQAVTKGIRPNREMKDSGIEWIGEIPKEWAVQRIKTIFNLRDERNYLPLEEVNLISLYTDKGVVQHSDLEKTTGNKASNADGYKIVCENDIIVNIILCWMGAIGRSDYQGVTSPAYDIYVPSNTIECRFYHHYFRTKGFSGDCYKRGKGIMAMRWRTYSDQFRDIKVVVPPLEEQQEILKHLDKKTAAIDSLIQKKEQLISELEAYKKSLIYEYVTGKKEAPAHAH